MDPESKEQGKTIIEEIEVAGHNLIEQIKGLIKEGNVRQIKLRAADGDFSLEVPVTVGVIVGSVLVVSAPWLAILGVIAAMITKLRIEVVREAPPADPTDAEAPPPDTGA